MTSPLISPKKGVSTPGKIDRSKLNQELNNLIYAFSVDDLPVDRARFYSERAKHLALISSGTSIESERMLKEIKKAISFVPNDPKDYLFLAKIYRLVLDLTSSMYCYRYAIKLDPHNFTAQRNLSEVLVLRGKEFLIDASKTKVNLYYFAAKSCFDEAILLDRDNLSLYVLKAICHVHMNQLSDAYDAVNKAIRPSVQVDAEVYILRAKILWGRGLIEQGNSDLRAAAAINPDHPEVKSYITRSYYKAELLYNDAVKYFAEKRYKESLDSIEHALFITKGDIKLYILCSKVHRTMGNLQLAYNEIMKAKEVFTKNSTTVGDYQIQLSIPSEITRQINLILNEMAINYAMNGDYDQAILLYNKIIKSETAISRGLVDLDNKFFINRGDCYRALSKLEDAITDYEFALSLEKDNWNIKTRLSLTHYLIATNEYNNCNYTTAEMHLNHAIDYNPKVSEYYALRGKTRYNLTDFPRSFRDFQKTLELDSTNEEIKLRINQFDDETKYANSNSSDKKKNSSSSLPAWKQHDNRILSITVEKDDMIEMMLNPQKARKLPAIKMLNKSIDVIEKPKIRSPTRSPNGSPPRSPRDVTNNLPRLCHSADLSKARIAALELIEKNKTVASILKPDKSLVEKDSMWNILATATELSRERGQKPPAIVRKTFHKKKKVATGRSQTTAATSRQEELLASLKNSKSSKQPATR